MTWSLKQDVKQEKCLISYHISGSLWRLLCNHDTIDCRCYCYSVIDNKILYKLYKLYTTSVGTNSIPLSLVAVNFWSYLWSAFDCKIMRAGSNLWYRYAALGQVIQFRCNFSNGFTWKLAFQFVTKVDYFTSSEIYHSNYFVESVETSSRLTSWVSDRSIALQSHVGNSGLGRAFSTQNTGFTLFLQGQLSMQIA